MIWGLKKKSLVLKAQNSWEFLILNHSSSFLWRKGLRAYLFNKTVAVRNCSGFLKPGVCVYICYIFFFFCFEVLSIWVKLCSTSWKMCHILFLKCQPDLTFSWWRTEFYELCFMKFIGERTRDHWTFWILMPHFKSWFLLQLYGITGGQAN